MAYPYSRRNIPRSLNNNQTQPRQRPLSSTSIANSLSLDEEDHLTSPPPLSPPRPFFLGSGPRTSGSTSDRGSWSAASSAEVSDVESDRESPAIAPRNLHQIPPAIPRQPGVRSPAVRSTTTPIAAPGSTQNPNPNFNHNHNFTHNARLPASTSASRRRSSAMAGYAQVDTVDPTPTSISNTTSNTNPRTNLSNSNSNNLSNHSKNQRRSSLTNQPIPNPNPFSSSTPSPQTSGSTPSPQTSGSGSDQSHETGEALGWDPTLLYQDALIPGTPTTAGSPYTPGSGGTAYTPGSGGTPYTPGSAGGGMGGGMGGGGGRAPPSSFTFPFQAYPGNPDPGTHIPGVGVGGIGLSSRRSSSESVGGGGGGISMAMHPRNPSDATYQSIPYAQSQTQLQRESQSDLDPPFAPFMAGGSGGGGGGGGGGGSVYRGSAAAAINNTSAPPSPIIEGSPNQLPRSSSTTTFRAPFLSPASRPSSSLWSPPSYSHLLVNSNSHSNDPNSQSPSGSTSALALALPKQKRPAPSNRLPLKLTKEEKPWMTQREPRARVSWWITFGLFVLGVGGAGVLCWSGMMGIRVLKDSELCSVLDEDFSGGTLDEGVWGYDNELGGFDNGEFQITTSSTSNIYIQNSQLYILPTLTSDSIGSTSAIFDGYTYTIPEDECSTDNTTACTVTSDASTGTVVNPVKSARISTKGSVSVAWGKVEVVAKLPRGDWLWPSIWMRPVNDTYGAYPASGEIDIMESRGNTPSYPAQGSNYVRSTLLFAPMESLLSRIYGWYSLKQSSFDKGFHTYGMEWDGDFMRFYTDTRVNMMLDLNVKKKGFWGRGKFPSTTINGSTEVVVTNPWAASGNNSAPFDQPFYLIIDLAAGGTSGWFPDGKGNKPWYDGSSSAMYDFAMNQSTWYATWPTSADDRAFRIKSVKMWQKC